MGKLFGYGDSIGRIAEYRRLPRTDIVNRLNAKFPEFQPTKMSAINDLVPKNQDLVIVVGAEYAVEMLSKVVGRRIAPQAFTANTHYVSSMDEAHKVLKQERNIDL